jgi:hypothetical protein
LLQPVQPLYPPSDAAQQPACACAQPSKAAGPVPPAHSPASASLPAVAGRRGPPVIPKLHPSPPRTPPPPPSPSEARLPVRGPHAKGPPQPFISCAAPRDAPHPSRPCLHQALPKPERRRNPSVAAFDSAPSSSSRRRGAAPELRQEVSVAPVPFVVDPAHPVALGPSPEFHRHRRHPFEPCLVFTIRKPFLLPRLSSSRRTLRLGENREANRAP